MGAHDPREWGYKATCQHGTTIPGCWPDEPRQHGKLHVTQLDISIMIKFIHQVFKVFCIVIICFPLFYGPPKPIVFPTVQSIFLVAGLLLIHHRVNNYLKQMCASKQWKEENLPQLEHDGNTAR